MSSVGNGVFESSELVAARRCGFWALASVLDSCIYGERTASDGEAKGKRRRFLHTVLSCVEALHR